MHDDAQYQFQTILQQLSTSETGMAQFQLQQYEQISAARFKEVSRQSIRTQTKYFEIISMYLMNRQQLNDVIYAMDLLDQKDQYENAFKARLRRIVPGQLVRLKEEEQREKYQVYLIGGVRNKQQIRRKPKIRRQNILPKQSNSIWTQFCRLFNFSQKDQHQIQKKYSSHKNKSTQGPKQQQQQQLLLPAKAKKSIYQKTRIKVD